MKITPLAHKVIGKLALIALLFAPFALTPSYAAELVGKPVPVGAQAATVAAAQASSDAQVAAKNAAAAMSASDAPIAAVAPVAPVALDEPTPPEAPTAPDLCASKDGTQSYDEIRRAIDELRDSLHQGAPAGFDGVSFGPDVIIPVVAMSLLFGGPILLLIVLAFLHYRAKARRQQHINMNIDKLLAEGKDIPLEMLLGEEAAVMKSAMPGTMPGAMPTKPGIVMTSLRDDSTMQKGVRNIGLGTGWLIFLTIMFSIEIGSFGFIFIGLGISQLVIWKLSSPSAMTKSEAPETLKAQD